MACKQLQSLKDFKQRRKILKCSSVVYWLGFSGCMQQKIASDEIKQQVNLLGLAGRQWKRLRDREGTCACLDIQWAGSTWVSVIPFFLSLSPSCVTIQNLKSRQKESSWLAWVTQPSLSYRRTENFTLKPSPSKAPHNKGEVITPKKLGSVENRRGKGCWAFNNKCPLNSSIG